MGYHLHGCSPRWVMSRSTIGSLTNRSTRRSTNGNREPLTIVTLGCVTSTHPGVRPAMALPQMRVPGVGNQDGNCTEVDAPVHDHALWFITGDAVQTHPLRGRFPLGDGRATSSRMGDDTLHCGTSSLTTGETHESHRWATTRRVIDATADGWCGTTPRLTTSVARGKPSLDMHARQDRTAASQPRDVMPSARPMWVFRFVRPE